MATLLGEWGFLDNLNDTSGNDRHGTLGAGTPTYVDGPQAGTRGIQFGTSTDYITLGRAGLEPVAEGVSVMGWVQFTGTTGADTGPLGVLSKARAATSSRSRIGISNNGVTRSSAAVARWKDDLKTPGGSSWTGDGWHHIALVDGNTTYALYVDGVLRASGSRALGSADNTLWEDFSWIVGYNATISDVFAHPQMSVSGVRIFQGELTAGEVSTWKDTAIVPAGPTFRAPGGQVLSPYVKTPGGLVALTAT